MSVFDNIPVWARDKPANPVIAPEVAALLKPAESSPAQALAELQQQANAEFLGEPIKRKGGRPKGSRNKPKAQL